MGIDQGSDYDSQKRPLINCDMELQSSERESIQTTLPEIQSLEKEEQELVALEEEIEQKSSSLKELESKYKESLTIKKEVQEEEPPVEESISQEKQPTILYEPIAIEPTENVDLIISFSQEEISKPKTKEQKKLLNEIKTLVLEISQRKDFLNKRRTRLEELNIKYKQTETDSQEEKQDNS